MLECLSDASARHAYRWRLIRNFYIAVARFSHPISEIILERRRIGKPMVGDPRGRPVSVQDVRALPALPCTPTRAQPIVPRDSSGGSYARRARRGIPHGTVSHAARYARVRSAPAVGPRMVPHGTS